MQKGAGFPHLRVLQVELPQSPGWYVISPEGDRSDKRSYQVPADIADNGFTDNTTLQEKSNRLTGKSGGSAPVRLDPSTEYTLHPTPETRNPKPETRNPKFETRNLKPETRNPKLETRNPRPETQDP